MRRGNLVQQRPNYPNYGGWQQPQQPNTQYPPQQPWQQPQYPPPPGTYYPPQRPMIPPPPPPRPPKKQNPWLVIATIIFVGAAIGAYGSSISTKNTNQQTDATTAVVATDTPIDTPAPTATYPASTYTPPPTQPPAKWTTTHTFTGNGIKKTAIFSVPDDWKILWSCNAQSFYGSQYNVQVYIYNSDNSLAEIAINELCKSNNTSGETEEHQSGDIYLEVNSEAAWKVQIQEFK